MSLQTTAPASRPMGFMGRLSAETADPQIEAEHKVVIGHRQTDLAASHSGIFSVPASPHPFCHNNFPRVQVQVVLSGGAFIVGTLLAGEDIFDIKSIEQPQRSLLDRFRQALDEWKGLLAPHLYDAVGFHVERLLKDQEELEEDGTVPSPSSFDDLLAFLASRPWDRAPAMGLSQTGQFLASWAPRSTRRTDVTLTFLGEGGVKWYVFGLGRKGKASAAGKSDRSDLAPLLSKLGCDEWMVA